MNQLQAFIKVWRQRVERGQSEGFDSEQYKYALQAWVILGTMMNLDDFLEDLDYMLIGMALDYYHPPLDDLFDKIWPVLSAFYDTRRDKESFRKAAYDQWVSSGSSEAEIATTILKALELLCTPAAGLKH